MSDADWDRVDRGVQQFRQKGIREHGILGDENDVINVPDRPGYQYVRVERAGGRETGIYLGSMRERLNTAVIVETNPLTGEQYIVGLDTEVTELAGDDPNTVLTEKPHAATHEWNTNADDQLIWLHTMQIFPLRVQPASTFKSVVIQEGAYAVGGEIYWKRGAETVDLTSYYGASAKWVLLYLDLDTDVNVQDDDAVDVSGLNPPPGDSFLLAAVRLDPAESSFDWSTDFVDLRYTSAMTASELGKTITVGTAPNRLVQVGDITVSEASCGLIVDDVIVGWGAVYDGYYVRMYIQETASVKTAYLAWSGDQNLLIGSCDAGAFTTIIDLHADGVNSIRFNPAFAVVGHIEGRISWNTVEHTIDVETGLGPVLQIGQEIYILFWNDTGGLIDNLTVLRPKGATIVSGEIIPTVEKAIADTFEGCEGTLMIATMDVPDASIGLATRFGRARGGNTVGFTPGAAIFLSDTVAGAFTETMPAFPSYDISLGGVLRADASDGEIFVSITRDIFDTVLNFWNGTIRESIDFLVTSNGVTVTGSLSAADASDNLTLIFNDGYFLLDVSPALTIVLTPGTDTNPQTNYVYILNSTKALTVSTADWPVVEHIKVATIVLRSATATQAEGALRNQNWNDHIAATDNFMGHLAHIGERIRQDSARWDSGAEGTVTIDTVPTPDAVYVDVTAGVIYQLHRQIFPALDMQTGDNINIVNDSVSPYKTVTDLGGQILDANGVSLNNTSFSFVVWGVCNKSGETSHMMLNLPTGSYGFIFPDNAVSDASNYSVYDIPKLFQGVGFLIARFTFTYKNDDWVLYDTQDLRGFTPNTAAGGGAGGGGVSTYLGLTDTPSAYTGFGGVMVRVNAGETALEFEAGWSNVDTSNVGRVYVSGTGDDPQRAFVVSFNADIDGYLDDVTKNGTRMFLGEDGGWGVQNLPAGAGIVTPVMTLSQDTSGNLAVAGFYGWIDDADTYITQPAADQMRIVCGGVTMVDFIEGAADYVNFGVNVGIGTIPETILNIKETGTSGARVWIQNDQVGHIAITRNMAGLQLSVTGMNLTNKYTPAIKWMSEDSAFTTENPKLLAFIVGRATESYAADTDGGMALDFATTPDNPGATNIPIVNVTITESGYVGIGTTTPAAQLSIYRDDAAVTDQLLIEQDGAGDAVMEFKLTATRAYQIGIDNADDYFKIAEGTDGLTTDTILTLTNTRTVGIRTATPEGIMHIFDSSAGTVTAASTANILVLEKAGAGGMSILTPDANASQIFFGSPSDSIAARINWQYSVLKMRIGTATAGGEVSIESANGVEAIYIDSNQNVGIGITPATAKVHIGEVDTAATGLRLTNTASESIYQYFNGAGANAEFYITYSGSGGADIIIQSDGDVILAQGGSVGIGTTSPATALHVVDTSAGASVNTLRIQNASDNNSTACTIKMLNDATATESVDGIVEFVATRTNADAVGDTNFTLKVSNGTALRDAIEINAYDATIGLFTESSPVDAALQVVHETAANLAVLGMYQGGTYDEFMHISGISVSGEITSNLVDPAEVASDSVEVYIKIHVYDDSSTITEGDYYVRAVELTAIP